MVELLNKVKDNTKIETRKLPIKNEILIKKMKTRSDSKMDTEGG